MNILEAMQDKNLFGRTFKPRLLRGDTWGSWRLFLATLCGLPVEESDRALIAKFTGRSDLPNAEAFTEAYVICGRRGGKSITAALIAAFLACLRDYSGVLAPGETGVVLILASDRKQARVIFSYVKALIEGAPALCKLIANTTKETIELTNNVRIEIHTSSYRTVRGYSIVACLCDELAFWVDAADGSNPAAEVLKAVRPGMSSIPGAVLMGLSSPYAKRGVLFDLFKLYYGKEGAPVLMWKAGSREMNSTISERTVATSRALDPAAARSEWDAEFRDDITSFIPLEIVEARTVAHRHELPPVSGVTYNAFVDASGGASDSHVICIAHLQGSVSVLDVLREITAPFSPEDAIRESADILKRYHVGTVTGDAYAGEWPREAFRAHGIDYRLSDLNRSELYLALLPLMMSGQCELLDNPRLKNQLVALERRTGRSGKDSIDHSPGAHDDCANAAAGALVNALGSHLVLGLVDLQLEEAAKQNAVAAGAILQYKEATEGCPQCGHGGIVNRGGAWLCTQCAFSWKGPKPTIQPTRPDPLRQVREDFARIQQAAIPRGGPRR